MRRLIHSQKWWEQDLPSLSREERYRALESYSDGTHIPVTLIQRRQKFQLVSPTPGVVIPDFVLYSREETARLWNAVLPVPPVSTTRSIDGMSLLQLPLDLQEKVAHNGAWPDDGLASTANLHGDLPQLVADARDRASGFHNIRRILEDSYEDFLRIDTSAAVPSSTLVPSTIGLPVNTGPIQLGAAKSQGVYNTKQKKLP